MIPSIRSHHACTFVHGFVLALALALNLGLSSSAAAQPNVLMMNDYLFPGQQLTSSCRYRFAMQTDGNLVLYDHNGVAHWASNTVGTGKYAVMQPDGNFVIYNTNGVPVWASGTQQWGSSSLRLQNDRNAVIYDATLTPRWATNTWTSSLPSVPSCIWYATKTNVWPGYDLPGGDYEVRTLSGSDLDGNNQAVKCAGYCVVQSQCGSFAYVPSTRQCWLKTTYGNFVKTNGVTAGFVTR